MKEEKVHISMAKAIIYARENAKMSIPVFRTELSDQCRIRCNNGQIKRWENGDLMPSVKSLFAIGKVCGLVFQLNQNTTVTTIE